MSVATTRPAEGEVFRGLLRGHRLRLGWSQDGLAALTAGAASDLLTATIARATWAKARKGGGR